MLQAEQAEAELDAQNLRKDTITRTAKPVDKNTEIQDADAKSPTAVRARRKSLWGITSWCTAGGVLCAALQQQHRSLCGEHQASSMQQQASGCLPCSSSRMGAEAAALGNTVIGIMRMLSAMMFRWGWPVCWYAQCE
jgi:hypothetical protein